MHIFCDIVANTCFVKSLASPADALYDKDILDLDGLSGSHSPFICGKLRKSPLGGCLIYTVGPKLSGLSLTYEFVFG